MFPNLVMSMSSQKGAISGRPVDGNISGLLSRYSDWNERIPFVFTCEPESLKELSYCLVIHDLNTDTVLLLYAPFDYKPPLTVSKDLLQRYNFGPPSPIHEEFKNGRTL